jgi:GNAT superfamily N-acetyltransferase
MLAIRRLTDADMPAVTAIAVGLPDYFTSDVPGRIERDAAGHDGWVLTDTGAVAGFAVVARRPPAGAEILWIAVDPARRGQRLGTALLDHVLDELAAAGVSVVEAKTLDPSAGYPPYEATRAFWEHKGFVHIDTIDPLPGWQPGNPAAIYVAALRPTR